MDLSKTESLEIKNLVSFITGEIESESSLSTKKSPIPRALTGEFYQILKYG